MEDFTLSTPEHSKIQQLLSYSHPSQEEWKLVYLHHAAHGMPYFAMFAIIMSATMNAPL